MSCKFSLNVEYFTNKSIVAENTSMEVCFTFNKIRQRRLECILMKTNSRNVDNGPQKSCNFGDVGNSRGTLAFDLPPRGFNKVTYCVT